MDELPKIRRQMRKNKLGATRAQTRQKKELKRGTHRYVVIPDDLRAYPILSIGCSKLCYVNGDTQNLGVQ